MTDLHERLQVIEDRLALADLIARYGPAVDSGDGKSLARDWCEEAVYAGDGWEFRGREAIAGIPDFPQHRAFMAQGCAHVLGPHAITLSGDTASARGHSLVMVHAQAQGLWQVVRASANLWQFRREPQGWRILRRDLRPLDGSPAAQALLQPHM